MRYIHTYRYINIYTHNEVCRKGDLGRLGLECVEHCGYRAGNCAGQGGKIARCGWEVKSDAGVGEAWRWGQDRRE